MSTMPRNWKDIIGIALADIHLCLKPPIWRSTEPIWFAAMLEPLLQVMELQIKLKCPAIIAGDIFDHWNTPAEVINAFLKFIPEGYAIPGQHDLPLHSYDDIGKSAYYNLCLHDRIQNMLPGARIVLDDMVLYGFPFGYEIESCERYKGNKHKLHIAIAHEYKFILNHSYKTVTVGHMLGRGKFRIIDNKWNGYDIVIYGDNHHGWSGKIPKCKTTFFNCGSLMRRRSDQKDYKPQIGLIYKDGSVKPWKLDISKDKYLKTLDTKGKKELLDMEDFLDELSKLGDSALDFTEAMKRFNRENKTGLKIRNIITKAMEK